MLLLSFVEFISISAKIRKLRNQSVRWCYLLFYFRHVTPNVTCEIWPVLTTGCFCWQATSIGKHFIFKAHRVYLVYNCKFCIMSVWDRQKSLIWYYNSNFRSRCVIKYRVIDHIIFLDRRCSWLILTVWITGMLLKYFKIFKSILYSLLQFCPKKELNFLAWPCSVSQPIHKICFIFRLGPFHSLFNKGSINF